MSVREIPDGYSPDPVLCDGEGWLWCGCHGGPSCTCQECPGCSECSRCHDCAGEGWLDEDCHLPGSPAGECPRCDGRGWLEQ